MDLGTIKKYLQEQRPNMLISNTELAKALNMDLGNITRKIKTKTSIKTTQFEKLENYFDIDLSKIMTNDNQCKKNTKTITIERIHINPSCGTGTYVYDIAETTPVTLGIDLIKNIFKVSNPNDLKIFQASGDSMEKTIYDGDLLLIDTSRKNIANGGIFIINRNNEWYCKRLRLKFNGDLEIISDNKNYDTELIRSDNQTTNLIPVGRVIKNLSRGL